VLDSKSVRARRLVGTLILIVCIGAPLVEAFDRWDDTLRDGNDTEANLVIAALCVGLAFSLVRTIVAWIRLLSSRFESRSASSTPVAVVRWTPTVPVPASSPPVGLRI